VISKQAETNEAKIPIYNSVRILFLSFTGFIELSLIFAVIYFNGFYDCFAFWTPRRGVTMGDLIEVFGALEPGDEVAVRGTDELREGTQVTPKQPPAK
jgi:hypothetical protein